MHSVAPSTENLPAAQLLQGGYAAEPRPRYSFPAGHTEHAVALALDHDGTAQASHAKLRPSSCTRFQVSARQVHPDSPVAPGEVEPDGHGTQSCVPPIE